MLRAPDFTVAVGGPPTDISLLRQPRSVLDATRERWGASAPAEMFGGLCEAAERHGLFAAAAAAAAGDGPATDGGEGPTIA
eukprot:gene7191-3960_t